jgi:hypothetical protein
MTQPSSLEINDLVVKSVTQSSKHRWTRFEYVCKQDQISKASFASPAIEDVHLHKLLELLRLHASIELSLFCRCQAARESTNLRTDLQSMLTRPLRCI